MRIFSQAFVTAAVCAISFGAAVAVAAPGDRSVSPGGVVGAPPSEAAAELAPSLGTGIPVTTRTTEASFPPIGLDTVAYGSVGKKGKSIINWDSRTRSYTVNYPTRAIVFIEYNGSHLCTGFMISRNQVATAGHCVHTGGSGGAWRNAALYRVYPGKDGASNPYGSCGVSWLRSVVGWTVNNNFRFDYGSMRLNCSVGNTVGWFGMYTPSSPTGQSAIVGGYPGDKPRTNWTSSDIIRSFSNEMISYRMDTVGGHSGSPVWHDATDATATNGAWAIGVHNYGVGAFGSNANSAARLTAARINNYIFWINQ